MNLKEIFDQLCDGELSQLSIGGADTAGVILPAAYPKVLNWINPALTALFTRFKLKEGRVLVELVPDQTAYVLHSDFAMSNAASQEPIKYILDDEGPSFQDDVLKIEGVRAETCYWLALNDRSNKYSVDTPSLRSLRVPKDVVNQVQDLPAQLKTETLEIVYRANHPKLVVSGAGWDPANVEVELPESHLMALLFNVASRVNNPTGMTNEFHAGNTWFAKYEAECQRLELHGIQVEDLGQNTRLERGGWV